MNLTAIKPRIALNKAYLKIKPNRSDIEQFKANLIQLLDRTNDTESEEFHKNLVIDFLKKTYYDPNHFINTKGRNDLVIHNSSDAKSTVGVIIEAKKPTNKAEMISSRKLNVKAFQELVLYFLRERITHKNLEVKHLVATNINEWYIFESALFEKLFAQNKTFVKQFEDFEAGRLSGKTTDFFYKDVAEPFIASLKNDIEYTFFDIREYEKPLRNNDSKDDNKLISLFKLLSPEHLLKLPFANDSNSLDKRFYGELLHIIGLVETKEGGKKVIQRKAIGEQNTGSLLENAIIQLDSLDKIGQLKNPKQFGANYEERLYNVGLELVITWINRILFLKLLEAQLISYHKGDKSFSFLNIEKLHDYDDLNSLFFQVLAKQHEQRNQDVKQVFEKVPYLNSSLFEPTSIEHETIFISNLRDDKALPVYSATVLKDESGKKKSGEINALTYLYEFLNAYDFSSEGSEEIQEDNKTLINASVLGLIFEKINGYKDGSFFTPGFITMYMCRETIRRATVQKFNEHKGWNCQNFEELKEDLQSEIGSGDRKTVRKQANELLNQLRLVDPSVGSGHFLVSSLNEIIAIKSELKILVDKNYEPLSGYTFEVVNDELVATDLDGNLFQYLPGNKESQRIQETLFHEKQTIIENCLFGVDINPNSVKICRLRLWIELLKNAYYISPLEGGLRGVTNETQGLRGVTQYAELQTLPNIDINIKCGNSLISRFGLDTDLKQALKNSNRTISDYKNVVKSYQNATSKEEKRNMEEMILQIKQSFSTEIRLNDPLRTKLQKLSTELYHRFTGSFLFEPETPYGKTEKELEKKRNSEKQKLESEINKIEKHFEEVKNNKIYENAFEWRFEFPEVLNDEGDFVGFDLVIGNPPYVDAKKLADISDFLRERYSVYFSSADLSSYFFEIGLNLLKNKGVFSFISTNKFFRTEYGKTLREFISKYKLHSIINFEQVPIFDEALVSSLIITMEKTQPYSDFSFVEFVKENSPNNEFVRLISEREKFLPNNLVNSESWDFSSENESKVIKKLFLESVRLKNIDTVDIKRGVTTGFDPAYLMEKEKVLELINKDSKNSEILKPMLKGREIKKYHCQENILFLLNAHNGLKNKLNRINLESEFPDLHNYLIKVNDENENKVKLRSDQGYHWTNLRDCAFLENFEKHKIVWPLTAAKWGFALDTNKHYLSSGGFMLISEDLNLKYLLGILNSNLMHFLFTKIGVMTAGGAYTLKKATIDEFPIKLINADEQKPFIDLVDQILDLKKQDSSANTSALEQEIDQLVYELYGLTGEEIKIVEGE
jgi:type II restriction/modification system DNA methylase subunit YeeA